MSNQDFEGTIHTSFLILLSVSDERKGNKTYLMPNARSETSSIREEDFIHSSDAFIQSEVRIHSWHRSENSKLGKITHGAFGNRVFFF